MFKAGFFYFKHIVAQKIIFKGTRSGPAVYNLLVLAIVHGKIFTSLSKASAISYNFCDFIKQCFEVKGYKISKICDVYIP